MASKVFNVRSQDQDDREMAMITDNRAAGITLLVKWRVT